MNQEIQKYLQQENPDFNTGFSLFCRFSRNQSLMSWIGRKKDMAKLIYELQKLLKAPFLKENHQAENHIIRFNKFMNEIPAPNPSDDELETRFKTFDDRKTRRSDLDEEHQAIYDAVAEDFKLRRGLHEKMKMAKDDSSRADFRKRILDVQERIEEGWKKIDAYLLQKQKSRVSGDRFVESSCRSYISKYINKENISKTVFDGMKVRAQALIDHGCVMTDETIELLKAKGILS